MAFRQRQSRGPCYDDPEAGPGPSTARFYSRSDTAPHVSDAYNSTSTSPDDDARALYSDEELIVTADTYPTPNDDHQVPDIQPVEEELASHVAMFLPSGSSQDDLVPQTRNGKIPGQRREGFRWCNEFVTDGLYKPYSHAEGEPSVEMTTLPPTRRRAISLDTFDGSAATPQWPGNVPAVRVHQPPFPPPARIPTPPGVPSFGTPEAMAASAQFTRGPSPPTTSSWRGRSPNGAIWRLFGLQSPSQSIPTPSPSPPATATATAATAIQSVRGIGRAPDGTRVLGGFGPRQSGHGMDLAQGLDDHTFHVDNIPLAATQATAAEPSPVESRRTSVGTAAETSSFRSTLSLPKRYARLFRPSIAEMFASTSPEPGSSPARSSFRSPVRSPSRDPTGDSTQDPVAMIAPPRNPARIRDQRRQRPGQDSPSNSFQRHTVVNQTIQEEEPGTEPVPVPQPSPAYNILSRISMPLPLCCCLRGRIVDVVNQGTDQGTPLGPITSRDSYTTAPSRSSPARTEGPQHHGSTGIPEHPERHVWTPAANFVRRGAAVLKQRIP